MRRGAPALLPVLLLAIGPSVACSPAADAPSAQGSRAATSSPVPSAAA